MKGPRGFRTRRVPVGIIHTREEEDGSWVLLAGDPLVKLDNKHKDGRPHMHVGDWQSEERWDLRADLTLGQALQVVTRQLEQNGFIDVLALKEELA